MDNVVDIIEAFLPNRATRRKYAGARCTMCGLGIVAVDFALVGVVSKTEWGLTKQESRPIHTACTALLWDEVARLREVAEEEGIE